MTTQNLDAPSSSPISEETLASSPLLARRPTVVHAEAETMAAQSERSSVRQTGCQRRPGERVGGEDAQRFELLEQLGVGGMGTVFLAQDTVLDRTVALKFLSHDAPSGAEVVELIRLEARATARLNHENIVRIFDLGSADGVPFLTMEYVQGQSLAAAAARGEIDALHATRIMADVARGLAHAHRMGIVHRDLKPSNVLLCKDGRTKILDFGIASVIAGLDEGRRATQLAGTPRYMGPEQWRNDAQDGRTDIWAAGVMFFELLTGHAPFPGERPTQILAEVLSLKPVPRVRALRPDLPEEAERIIEHAMCKDIAKRLGTANELLDLLVGLELALGRAATPGAQTRPRAERRQVTLLSCSLADLLPLSEDLELDQFAELLDAFFAICMTVVKQLGGTILTALGGRMVACFGFPVAHEDDAQRAVRAATLVNDAVSALSRKDDSPHGARIGVHTSLAVVGRHGDGEKALVQGEGPMVATWLEQQAGRGEILLSRRTQALLRGTFEVESLGERAPEGGRSIEVMRALRPVDAASRFDQLAARELTPVVGREAEAELLRAAWASAREGEGQVVLLVGEAGIGKSRLVQLLKEQLADEPHARISCQCWSHFAASALHPIVDGLLRGVGIHTDSPGEERLRRLDEAIASLRLDAGEYVPLLATYLSIPLTGGYAAPALSPDLLRSRVMEALINVILRLAARQPTLLVVEDVHWSDASTLELLDLLLPRATAARLCVVITFRPEFQPPWADRAHVRRVSLARLTGSQTAALVALNSRGRGLPAAVVERLVQRAEGIPLFIEELTTVVADTWQSTARGAAPGFAPGFAADAIPGSLHELLLARLDALGGAGKEVAQVGAVLGREFRYELFQRVCLLDEGTFRRGLMQVVESGILRPEGLDSTTRYVFKHALLQEAAYQSLVKSARSELHRRAAAALAEHFPQEAEIHPELLAHHRAEAGDVSEAIAHWEKAGERATQRSALVEAIDHYRRAREALATLPGGPERDRRELALLLAMGSPLMSVHGYATPEVERLYARARELARATGAHADVFPAMQGLWQFYYVRGMLPVSRELGNELLEIAREAESSTFLLLAHRSIASSAFLQGDYEACRDHTQAGYQLYDVHVHGALALRTGHDPGVAHGVYLAWALWMLGYPDQALRWVNDMIELARRLAHPLSLAFALCYAALVRNYRGEHDEARSLADEALRITVPNKFALWTAWATTQRGWGVAGGGDFERGIPQMKEGIEGWKNTGARVGLTFFWVALADACFRAGRAAETAQLLADATPMIAKNDEHFYEPEMCRLEAELAAPESPEAALAHYDRGLELARRLQGKAWELRLATSRARLLAGRGERAQAASDLGRVLAWFTEGDATADLRAASALLESLLV